MANFQSICWCVFWWKFMLWLPLYCTWDKRGRFLSPRSFPETILLPNEATLHNLPDKGCQIEPFSTCNNVDKHLCLVISVNIDWIIIFVSNETLSGARDDTKPSRKQGDSISSNFLFNHKAESKGITFDAVSLEKREKSWKGFGSGWEKFL